MVPVYASLFAYRFPHVSNLSVFMLLCISCRFRLNQFCSTLSDAFRSPHLRHMLLVPMSVHSLFKYFQLVSAHALSTTVHDSPRIFRKQTYKRALEFLPLKGEKEPSRLINHLEWGLRGKARATIFPLLQQSNAKAKAKAKAKASKSSSGDDDEGGSSSFGGSLFNMSESD
jgi:hypothetical protein